MMSADRWARIQARVRYGDLGAVTEELIERYAEDGTKQIECWLTKDGGK
jgi:hypothetical protein